MRYLSLLGLNKIFWKGELFIAAATGLESLTTIFTWLTTQFGGMVDTIVSKPILLLPVGIFATGAVIGLAKRLIGA